MLAQHVPTQHHATRVLFRHLHAIYHNSVHAPIAHMMTGLMHNAKIVPHKPAQRAPMQHNVKLVWGI